MPIYDFSNAFSILSEVLEPFADRSKLPDTDDHGIQFFEFSDRETSGYIMRFVTIDNITVEVALDMQQLAMLAADSVAYLGALTEKILNNIAQRRRERQAEGVSIILPRKTDIALALEGALN